MRLFERKEFPTVFGEPTLNLFSLGIGEADRMGVLLLHLDQDLGGVVLAFFWPSFDAFEDFLA